MYSLLIRPKAEKNFAKIPQKLKLKVLQNLKKLEQDPFQNSLDVKKLTGTKRSYRLRVGEIRVIYELDTKTKEIFVGDIDFRRTGTY